MFRRSKGKTLTELNNMHKVFVEQAKEILNSKGIEETEESISLVVRHLLKEYINGKR